MAPEQIRGASQVDERADLYAFAMVAFEALCGRLAYDASGSIALIACKLEKPARSIRDLARMPIPPGLDLLLARCLARTPADRPASAAELLRDWRTLGAPTIAPTPQPPGTRRSDPPTETGVTAAPTLATSVQARRGGRVGLAVAASALVASCIVLGLALRLRAHAPPAAVAGAIVATGEAPMQVDPPATADPPPVENAPPLEIPPVVLSAGAPPDLAPGPDADAGTSAKPPPRVRPPIRRSWPSGPGRRKPTEPQIVTEPRY
jgi:serine/threonine-protein kinase